MVRDWWFAALLAASFGSLYTVATTKIPIISQRFLKVIPDYSIDDAPRPDLIILPGGSSDALMDDSKFMAWAGTAFNAQARFY